MPGCESHDVRGKGGGIKVIAGPSKALEVPLRSSSREATFNE